MDRATLAADIVALAALDHSVLQDPSKRDTTRSAEGKSTAPATHALDTTSIGTCSADESQDLTKAYIRSMREDVMGIEHGKSDAIGAKIDIVREKAQSMSKAVGDVRA